MLQLSALVAAIKLTMCRNTLIFLIFRKMCQGIILLILVIVLMGREVLVVVVLLVQFFEIL